MKKISVFLYVSSVILALSFFASGFSVLAKSNELTSPGLTPDSYFYFLDTFGEKINLFFTFSPEKKAEKALGYAEERIAEVKVMAEESKAEAAEIASDSYKRFLDLADTKVGEAKDEGKDVSELATRITEATLKHHEILVRVFNQIPDQAQAAIQKAIETSIRGSRTSVERVSDELKEELLEKIEEAKSGVEEIIQEQEIVPPPALTIAEIEGVWVPYAFYKFDLTSGEFRQKSFAGEVYVAEHYFEIKGSALCDDGQTDKDGRKIIKRCHDFDPFTLKDNKIIFVGQKNPPTVLVAMNNGMLELIVEPSLGSAQEKQKLVLKRFTGPIDEVIKEETLQPRIERKPVPPEVIREETQEIIVPPAQSPVIELPTLEQKIRITSPSGGEQWVMGNTYTIKWVHPGNISGFYVDLYKGGVYMAGLGGFGARPGLFLESPASWEWNTIDTSNFEAGTDFKIRVKSSADNAIYDESDNYFSIAAPAISPTTCDYLKNNSANNRFFESCRKGSYDQICFDKYYSTYQGCGRSFEYGGCVVNNMNADKNIECDTGLVYTCKDSENLATRYGMKSDYNTQGTVTDAGKTYLDYCVDASTLKEYSCVVSDIFPSGISREENYLCPNGCLNGACK